MQGDGYMRIDRRPLTMGILSAVLATASLATMPSHAGDDAPGTWLGVSVTEETDLPEGGALVTGVAPGSPADEAGLREGDVVQAVDGRVVRGPRALAEQVGDQDPGDRVVLRIVRDGDERSIDATLAERDRGAESEPRERVHVRERRLGDAARHHEFRRHRHVVIHGRPRLGVQLLDATPELREHLGGDADSGVLVSKVIEGMPAAEAGLRVGDLIVAVDGEPVEHVGDLVHALSDREGQEVEIEVVRDHRRATVRVALREDDGDA
jgi:serine protease Do